jgi:nitrogen regulatory protein PII
MKQIHAYITQRKLNAITRALRKIKGLTGMSIIKCSGYGRGMINENEPRFGLSEKIKLEIFCKDELVKEVTDTLINTAQTGLKGDGKIYVCDVIDAFRISTGENGENAI